MLWWWPIRCITRWRKYKKLHSTTKKAMGTPCPKVDVKDWPMKPLVSVKEVQPHCTMAVEVLSVEQLVPMTGCDASNTVKAKEDSEERALCFLLVRDSEFGACGMLVSKQKRAPPDRLWHKMGA